VPQVVQYTIAEDTAAYDQLPAPVRAVVRNTSVPVSSVQALQALQFMTVEQVCAKIRQLDAQMVAQHRYYNRVGWPPPAGRSTSNFG